MKKMFLAVLVFLLGGLAYALPDYWNVSFAQGYLEYGLTNKDENTVIIACNKGADSDWDHGVHLYSELDGSSWPSMNDDGVEVSVEFLIDDISYYFPLETKTRSGIDRWMLLTEAISNAKRFSVFWDGEFFGRFESKNTEKTIADIANCKSMYHRDLDDNYTETQSTQKPLLLPKEQPQRNRSIGKRTMSGDSLEVLYRVVNQGYGTSSTYVYIVSKENSIAIEGINLNRGNCPLFRGEKGGVAASSSHLPKHLREIYGKGDTFPVYLNYGQETYFVFNNCPNVLEATIQTSMGAATYNF